MKTGDSEAQLLSKRQRMTQTLSRLSEADRRDKALAPVLPLTEALGSAGGGAAGALPALIGFFMITQNAKIEALPPRAPLPASVDSKTATQRAPRSSIEDSHK